MTNQKNKEGFICDNCHRWVSTSKFIGTHHRNHCPFCLWSKHVDLKKAGDRKASCKATMKPIGLTFKRREIDKYGRPRQGELMLIHQCTNENCGKISINRIAADDDPTTILEIFKTSQKIDESLRNKLNNDGVKLLTEIDEKKIRIQLFGKN